MQPPGLAAGPEATKAVKNFDLIQVGDKVAAEYVETEQEIFMKTIELQPGYGFGIEQFRIVFVFATPGRSTPSWTPGGSSGPTSWPRVWRGATSGGGAAAVTVSPGVTMYQLTQDGATAGISLTGARYYRDDPMNMRTLLGATAVVEAATGVALLLAPALPVSVLLGSSLDAVTATARP